MNLADIAGLFEFVREAGQNKGLRVNAIQTWSGGQSGDSWCMEAAWLCLDLRDAGKSLVPREQSVESFHQLAIEKGWIIPEPEVGCLVISINAAGLGHHIGMVTGLVPLESSAGNTSEDGTSSNGDGWYRHQIDPANKVYVRVPTP